MAPPRRAPQQTPPTLRRASPSVRPLHTPILQLFRAVGASAFRVGEWAEWRCRAERPGRLGSFGRRSRPARPGCRTCASLRTRLGCQILGMIRLSTLWQPPDPFKTDGTRSGPSHPWFSPSRLLEARLEVGSGGNWTFTRQCLFSVGLGRAQSRGLSPSFSTKRGPTPGNRAWQVFLDLKRRLQEVVEEQRQIQELDCLLRAGCRTRAQLQPVFIVLRL